MALRVWLPLTQGNFNNQGVGAFDVVMSATSPTWESGKTGNNLRLTNNATNRVTLDKLVGTKKLTCSLWFSLHDKDNINAFSDIISLGVKKISTSATSYFRIEINNARTGIGWWGNNIVTTDSGCGGMTVANDTWYHIVMVTNGEKIWFYRNGALYSTYTINDSYKNDFEFLGDVRLGDTGNMDVRLADVRIYDECLSDKQIKEIAKGLVCHYKLEGAGANPNLVTDSLPKRMMESRWSCNSSRALDDTVLFNGQPSLHLYTSTAGYLGLHKGAFPCKPNTTYHATAYVYKKTMNDIPSNRPLRIYFPARETSSGSVINYHHYISFTSEMEAGK